MVTENRTAWLHWTPRSMCLTNGTLCVQSARVLAANSNQAMSQAHVGKGWTGVDHSPTEKGRDGGLWGLLGRRRKRRLLWFLKSQHCTSGRSHPEMDQAIRYPGPGSTQENLRRKGIYWKLINSQSQWGSWRVRFRC